MKPPKQQSLADKAHDLIKNIEKLPPSPHATLCSSKAQDLWLDILSDLDKTKLNDFERGDIVRHKSGTSAYLIDGNYGEYVIGVKTISISNPSEWDIIFKAAHLSARKKNTNGGKRKP